jgi:hypothetical protein
VSRTAREVFEDHLRIGTEGTVEEDIERNYASTVVILAGDGVRHGHDGLRERAAKLQGELPNCTFRYGTQLVEGRGRLPGVDRRGRWRAGARRRRFLPHP